MELIYTCIAKMCAYLVKNEPSLLTETLKAYADPEDYNRTFYYGHDEVLEDKIQKLLKDSDELLNVCGEKFEEVSGYEQFV